MHHFALITVIAQQKKNSETQDSFSIKLETKIRIPVITEDTAKALVAHMKSLRAGGN